MSSVYTIYVRTRTTFLSMLKKHFCLAVSHAYANRMPPCLKRMHTTYFISDNARTASVLNGLKNEPSDELMGEVILKINLV
jgi:hypothetical protein